MRNYREATQIHIKVLLQCQVYIYSTSTANNTHKNKNSVIAFFLRSWPPSPQSGWKKQIKLLTLNCEVYIWLFLQSSKIGSFIFAPLPLCNCTIWTSFDTLHLTLWVELHHFKKLLFVTCQMEYFCQESKRGPKCIQRNWMKKMVYLIKKVKPRYRNKMCAGNNSSNRESNKDTGTDKINYKNWT